MREEEILHLTDILESSYVDDSRQDCGFVERECTNTNIHRRVPGLAAGSKEVDLLETCLGAGGISISEDLGLEPMARLYRIAPVVIILPGAHLLELCPFLMEN